MYQPLMVEGAQHARFLEKSIACFVRRLRLWGLWLGILGVFGAGGLSAQGVKETDLSRFAYAVAVSGETLGVNDAATVTLSLGTSAAPVTDAIGLRLDLVLGEGVKLPTSALEVKVLGSWLLSNGSMSQAVTVDAGTRMLHLDLVRADSAAQSGYGFALSFPLVSETNGLLSRNIVARDGGMVIQDEISTKWAQMPLPQQAGAFLTPLASPACFPNPTAGSLYVPLAQSGAVSLRFTDLGGKATELPCNVLGGIGVADIAPLKQGVYVLEVMQDGRIVSRQRVVRQ